MTVPTQIVIDTVTGKDPLQSPRAAGQSAGNLIQQGSRFIAHTSNAVYQLPRPMIRQNLGDDWLKFYDAATIVPRVQAEIGAMAGGRLGSCLQGVPCSLDEMVAIPLAGALKDAHRQFLPYSQALPPEVKEILHGNLPAHVVESARIVIADPPDFGSLPGFINTGNKVAGLGHAVTIGNIMVFSEPVDLSNPKANRWFLHEMAHIEQYMPFGSRDIDDAIELFAAEYIRGYQNMEDEAWERADVWWRSPVGYVAPHTVKPGRTR